jgi:hypothetical protein
MSGLPRCCSLLNRLSRQLDKTAEERIPCLPVVSEPRQHVEGDGLGQVEDDVVGIEIIHVARMIGARSRCARRLSDAFVQKSVPTLLRP